MKTLLSLIIALAIVNLLGCSALTGPADYGACFSRWEAQEFGAEQRCYSEAEFRQVMAVYANKQLEKKREMKRDFEALSAEVEALNNKVQAEILINQINEEVEIERRLTQNLVELERLLVMAGQPETISVRDASGAVKRVRVEYTEAGILIDEY